MKVRFVLQVVPAALLALAGCASSKANSPQGASTASSPQALQAQAAMCPMQVPGTKVEASNTDTGAALTFTTSGDATELRKRVATMAEMHNAHHAGAHEAGGCPCCAKHGAQGGGGCDKCEHMKGEGAQAQGEDCCAKCEHMRGTGGSGGGCDKCEHMKGEGGASCCGKHGMKAEGGTDMPASRATVEELPNGARLVLTPVDPAQLDALRSHVQHHAQLMSSGNCPMMQGHAESHHG